MAPNNTSSLATSSDNDNDTAHPRTPPLAALPNTARSLATAPPSKIPKLRTASVSISQPPQAPVSPPRTPTNRDITPTTALDWGSGGEWSAIVGERKCSASEGEGEAVNDDDDVDDSEPVEVSEDAQNLPLEDFVASSGLFGEFEGAKADLEGVIDDGIEPKEVSDDDYEPLIVFEDGDQQDGGEEEEVGHGGVVLDAESSDGAGSLSSDSEISDVYATSALREHYDAAESSDEVSDDEVFPVVSALEESERHIVTQGGSHENGQDGSHETAEQEIDPSEADASQTSSSNSDIQATSGFKHIDDIDNFKQVNDNEELPFASASEDLGQHVLEQQEDIHEHAMQGSDYSASDAFQSSGSDSDIDTTSDPKQPGDTDRIKKLGNEQYADVPSPKDVGQQIFEQKNPHETTIQETELSDADVSHASDSDVSDMQLPAVTIRGPFLNTVERGRTAARGPAVSPEMVLRGLIRDAHAEMIHFTLPHSMFSPDDLRNGLQYAYSMLQVATYKLTILAMLDDEATNMTGSDLRRWVELVDNLNPRTRTETRISVIFESLSIGEMKAALEELVQSRLVVEGEAEKTQMLLMGKVVVKERQEKSVVIPAKRAAEIDQEGGISTKKRRVCEENNETALDAFLTAIMVVLIGVLYLCVREWPIGSVGDRWMNMKT